MKILTTLLLICTLLAQTQAELTVFAAASTTDAMRSLAQQFEQEGGEKVRFNFASSGALARQIDAGAPADVFVSANIKWMDYLEAQHLLQPDSRIDVVRNELVLIAPSNSALTYEGFPGNLTGRLSTGDPKSVPAGAYAFETLTALGMLDTVKSKLVTGKDVRTVLMYVERDEVDAGIVYSTDALRSTKALVIGTFPAESYPAIIYPAAAIQNGSASAGAFLAFISSEAGGAIWERYGFKPAP